MESNSDTGILVKEKWKLKKTLDNGEEKTKKMLIKMIKIIHQF